MLSFKYIIDENQRDVQLVISYQFYLAQSSSQILRIMNVREDLCALPFYQQKTSLTKNAPENHSICDFFCINAFFSGSCPIKKEIETQKICREIALNLEFSNGGM